MAALEKVLYTAKTRTTGGREGSSKSDDGQLAVKLTSPGKGGGTNPEQLFAAGWSACFIGAMKAGAAQMKIALSPEVAVDAEVDLGTVGSAYTIQARFNVSIPGMDKKQAQDLVNLAHTICPYSRATHGNVHVTTNLV